MTKSKTQATPHPITSDDYKHLPADDFDAFRGFKKVGSSKPRPEDRLIVIYMMRRDAGENVTTAWVNTLALFKPESRPVRDCHGRWATAASQKPTTRKASRS